MATSQSAGVVDPAIFEHLQAKIDEDTEAREEIRGILQKLDRQLSSTIAHAEESIKPQIETISQLATVASKYPYYRYNGMWTRDIQNVCYAIILCGWLGGYGGQSDSGRLLTLEEVGGIMNVPVNLRDRDAFHLTIEEYLQALISLIEELARLAVNAVTLGDYQRPLRISQFIKDLHAGFQILNLKNDTLRRRTDSIKYQVKKVEDVVYDLSLRNLIPPSQ
ncbi:MAG: hypothetical protein M1816_001767 [Peltula sp. TS41687]|nr:MAG: hypothetical protein M1816_001767 [Peltula sp. TS41687]